MSADPGDRPRRGAPQAPAAAGAAALEAVLERVRRLEPLQAVAVPRGRLPHARSTSATRGGSPPLVVALDGPSGSGKTELGEALASRMPAALVHMDDLYPGWDGLARGVFLVTELVLAPLARGEPAAYRRWDWRRGGWGETVVVMPSRVLVVEGCGASVRPAGPHAALRVWLDADPRLRMRRALQRDGESFRPHWHRWAEQERRVFGADRTRQRADLVLDTTPSPGSTMPASP